MSDVLLEVAADPAADPAAVAAVPAILEGARSAVGIRRLADSATTTLPPGAGRIRVVRACRPGLVNDGLPGGPPRSGLL